MCHTTESLIEEKQDKSKPNHRTILFRSNKVKNIELTLVWCICNGILFSSRNLLLTFFKCKQLICSYSWNSKQYISIGNNLAFKSQYNLDFYACTSKCNPSFRLHMRNCCCHIKTVSQSSKLINFCMGFGGCVEFKSCFYI